MKNKNFTAMLLLAMTLFILASVSATEVTIQGVVMSLDDGISQTEPFSSTSGANTTNGTVEQPLNLTEALSYSQESLLLPTATLFESNEETTNFSEVDVTDVPDMTLATSNAKIKWVNNVNAENEDYDTNINMGAGFVSVNASALDSSINTSAEVSVNVASCDSWTIYYASQPVSSLAELISVGEEVGSGSGESGSCSSYCSNPSCVGNVLAYTVEHFDGTGGEGEGADIPEFSILTLGLGLMVILIGLAIIRRKR